MPPKGATPFIYAMWVPLGPPKDILSFVGAMRMARLASPSLLSVGPWTWICLIKGEYKGNVWIVQWPLTACLSEKEDSNPLFVFLIQITVKFCSFCSFPLTKATILIDNSWPRWNGGIYFWECMIWFFLFFKKTVSVTLVFFSFFRKICPICAPFFPVAPYAKRWDALM